MQPAVRLAPPPRRSRAVTLLAWLHLLQSLALLGFAIYLLSTEGWQPAVDAPEVDFGPWQYLPLALFDGMVSAVAMLVLAVLGVLIAIALLRLHGWAWLAAMSLQGMGLVAALYGYLHGRPNYIGMLIGIFLVFYLNQREVQAAFRSSPQRESQAAQEAQLAVDPTAGFEEEDL